VGCENPFCWAKVKVNGISFSIIVIVSVFQDIQAGPVFGELRRRSITLHRRRYDALGYLDLPEPDPYENSSTYIAATDGFGDIVGVTRLIHLPLEKLPSVACFSIQQEQLDRFRELDEHSYAEIGALVSKPGKHTLLPLVKAAHNHSMLNRMVHWFCCIVYRVHKYLEQRLRISFEVIGTPRMYLGSLTTPCYLHLPTAFESMRSEVRDYFRS